ncbi:MAG: hypothetical protein O3A46_15525 [Candidatus Poribacteria bacterium]|nr:hypothetical protein [Candidatus Poribacteria bacterium]
MRILLTLATLLGATLLMTLVGFGGGIGIGELGIIGILTGSAIVTAMVLARRRQTSPELSSVKEQLREIRNEIDALNEQQADLTLSLDEMAMERMTESPSSSSAKG